MKEAITVIGFSLLIIGTIGLLITEFALESGCTASRLTKVFAASNVAGLATLAYVFWGMRSRYQ